MHNGLNFGNATLRHGLKIISEMQDLWVCAKGVYFSNIFEKKIKSGVY